jgi:hypothetical protein
MISLLWSGIAGLNQAMAQYNNYGNGAAYTKGASHTTIDNEQI